MSLLLKHFQTFYINSTHLTIHILPHRDSFSACCQQIASILGIINLYTSEHGDRCFSVKGHKIIKTHEL